jgi:POT family proton-dependent oligopeptide transporter
MLGLPGGWIADRFIGQRKAVFWGGVLIMLGHLCLAVPILATFYGGLVLIALGTGLLKPNVSTIVGQLYSPDDERRDAGFSLYYMGINIGAGTAPLVIGTFAQSETFRGWLQKAGIDPNMCWHFGFGAAAIGMFFGLLQYVRGGKRLGEAGLRPTPPKDEVESTKNRRMLKWILGALVGVPAIYGLIAVTGVITLTEDRVQYSVMGLVFLIAAGFFYVMFTVAKWTPEERRRIYAILALFFGAIFFFSIFDQAGSTFNVFAFKYSQNTLFGWSFPSSYWQVVNSGFIIALAPVFAAIWTYLARRQRDPSWPIKFGVGLILVAVGCLVMVPAGQVAEAGGKASDGYLLSLYFFHTCAELCLSPVGLSSMSRVAPRRIAGLALGVWFMGTGIGDYLTGVYAGMTEDLPLPRLFITMAIPAILAGILFFVLARPLRRMSRG